MTIQLCCTLAFIIGLTCVVVPLAGGLALADLDGGTDYDDEDWNPEVVE